MKVPILLVLATARGVDAERGQVTTLAGTPGSSAFGATDGTGTNAQFVGVWGVDVSSDGSLLFVADLSAHRIRQVVISTRVVTTFAGTSLACSDYPDTPCPGRGDATGTGTNAAFDVPCDVDVSADGASLYVADWGNHRIKKIVIATRVVTVLAGSGTSGSADGTGESATFNSPKFLVDSSDGAKLFVTVSSTSGNVRQIIVATGVVSTLASVDNNDTPRGIAISSNDATLYVATQGRSDISLAARISAIDIATGGVTTLAGNTPGASSSCDQYAFYTSTTFSHYPQGLALSTDGSRLFVADLGCYSIREVKISSGDVATLAGTGINLSLIHI